MTAASAAGRMPEDDLNTLREHFLLPGDTTIAALQTRRDSFVFTDQRLIIESPHGIYGKTTFSIPYSRIAAVAVQTAKPQDRHGELAIYAPGLSPPKGYGLGSAPIRKTVEGDISVHHLAKQLMQFVLD